MNSRRLYVAVNVGGSVSAGITVTMAVLGGAPAVAADPTLPIEAPVVDPTGNIDLTRYPLAGFDRNVDVQFILTGSVALPNGGARSPRWALAHENYNGYSWCAGFISAEDHKSRIQIAGLSIIRVDDYNMVFRDFTEVEQKYFYYAMFAVDNVSHDNDSIYCVIDPKLVTPPQ